MVFRMFFGANPQLHSLVQNMVSAAAAAFRSLCSDAWRAGEAIQRLELCGAQLVARFGGFEFRASSVDKLSTLKF